MHYQSLSLHYRPWRLEATPTLLHAAALQCVTLKVRAYYTHAVADAAWTDEVVATAVVEHLASLLKLVVRVDHAPGQSEHIQNTA